ncbi:hypothetical protein A1O1_01682 [Capronia coronata CBS 617.96]|uniref:4-coumarate-CoA ligase n=1 Tax=Capronia coronata CBS 617.96 TaxID=1182541 RepID=W9YUB7_9EURO|nr:uncharacterized protein A1O1_01682 [Capronia coronata CBS 617.96]EXJ93290.1 hypothetical protein A1O1_01682 [Capronia coronata CBS 617.96]
MPPSTVLATGAVWTSSESLTIPSTDILSFVFANLDQYDNDKPIFIDAADPTNSISARRAFHVTRRLIKGLKDLGLQEGDCVCVHAFNNIWYPLIWLAIIGSGACVSGTNPACNASELVRHFRLTKPKFIFAQGHCIQGVMQAASACHIPVSNIFVVDLPKQTPPVDGCRTWWTLLVNGENDWSGPSDDDDDASVNERIAVYSMTSGTTGLPKAAMIPHRSIVTQSTLLERQFDARSYEPSQLICLPVFHAFALPLALVLPLRLGIQTYFLPRFVLQDFLQAVDTHEITDTPLVPPIIAALNQLPHAQRHLLRSLRYVICAGAPMPASVQTEVYKVLSKSAVVAQCWGTTEAGWHTLFDWNVKDTSGSVGRLLPNVQMRLVDVGGVNVGQDGQLGEALIKSPTLFTGYLGNPDKTRDAFDSDGFYRTGDRVSVLDDKVFYEGRIKEVMKVKGWQVAPQELETVLMKHPQISDVAVVGITRDDGLGLPETLPCAYVVRAPVAFAAESSGDAVAGEVGRNSPLTAKAVQQLVAAKLISYKRLTGGVVFVKQIPRSATGKILRHRLSEMELDVPNGVEAAPADTEQYPV